MRWLVGAILALVVLLPSSAAQPVEDPVEPEVEFPDVRIEDPVVPLDEVGLTTVEATIECSMLEPPVSATVVTPETTAPSYASVIVSPASTTFSPDPVACAQGTPHAYEANLSIALTQNAPAFERFDTTVAITVQYGPPTGVLFGPYGPYHANVSVMPGFLLHYNVRADQKISTVAPGGTATFDVALDNFSNGPTKFTLDPASVPDGLDVSLPDPVVLDTQEAATLTVEATDVPGASTEENHPFRLDLHAASTNPRAEETGSSELSLLVKAEPGAGDPLGSASEDGDEAGVPAPGVATLVAALVGAIAIRRRDP